MYVKIGGWHLFLYRAYLRAQHMPAMTFTGAHNYTYKLDFQLGATAYRRSACSGATTTVVDSGPVNGPVFPLYVHIYVRPAGPVRCTGR